MRTSFIIATVTSWLTVSAAAWIIPMTHDGRGSTIGAKKIIAARAHFAKKGTLSSKRLLNFRAGAMIPLDPGFVQSTLKYGVEATGTFIFLSSILAVVKDKIVFAPAFIGMVLTAMMVWGGRVSGGHFNPAVSVMFWLNKSISLPVMGGYIISQLIGAVLAWIFVGCT
jgi:glycerol uptake facilitator-like aquaporin